jgi:GT2 family glycosyltransferase
MIDVSIISINYNNSNLTKNFIESIVKFTSKSIRYEIIIVDNCSELGDFENLKNILAPFDLKIIRSKINLGFGGGNMLGVQHATGRYFAFINNDVLFVEDSLSSLKDFMEVHPKIGIVGPQQLDVDSNPVYSFDHFHGIRKLLFGTKMVEMTSKATKRRKIKYNSIFPVDLVLGSFMFFKSDVFAAIGGFDTNIFFYYEEMDICYRAKKIGYTSFLNPTTSYIHLEGSSTKAKYIIKKERNLSRLYILKKNHNYIKYSIIRFYFLTKWLFKSIINYKNFDLVFDIIKGSYSESSLKHQQKINLK